MELVVAETFGSNRGSFVVVAVVVAVVVEV